MNGGGQPVKSGVQSVYGVVGFAGRLLVRMVNVNINTLKTFQLY